MSKEREDFEAYASDHPKQDFDLTTDFIGGVDWYVSSETRQAWEDWQVATESCAAHYQPLLAEKDAEIAILKDVADSAGWFLKYEQLKNTTIKALLEQAREALEALQNDGDKVFHPDDPDDPYKLADNAINAINAATGEK